MTTPMPLSDTTNAADDLLVIQKRVNSLADPASLVDGVLADLDRLYQGGADPGVLDAIEDTTQELLEHARQLYNTMSTTIELARALRSQREEARQSLDELREAISTVDTNVPEIEELHDAIEEMAMEWIWDAVYEGIYDQISQNSPLTWGEAVKLIALLTEDELPEDHPLWLEIREWLAFAEEQAAA